VRGYQLDEMADAVIEAASSTALFSFRSIISAKKVLANSSMRFLKLSAPISVKSSANSLMRYNNARMVIRKNRFGSAPR
jgi:hypothetical protein